jgi:Iron-containing redox enzyme
MLFEWSTVRQTATDQPRNAAFHLTDLRASFIWRYHMPSPLADRVHETLNGQPLTREQYVGLLGQLYHFSAAAQSHLRAVVDRIDDPALSRWFAKHAREETGHHRWAELDLKELGEAVPPPLPATLRLIRHIEQVADGPKPYLVLGISHVAENLSPMLDPTELLPKGIGRSMRYVGTHVLVDRTHVADVNLQVSLLPTARRAEVLEESRQFAELMFEFLLESAGMNGD